MATSRRESAQAQTKAEPLIKSRNRVRDLAEVYTAEREVRAMLAPVLVRGFWAEDKVVTVIIIQRRYRREATECDGSCLRIGHKWGVMPPLGQLRHNTHPSRVLLRR